MTMDVNEEKSSDYSLIEFIITVQKMGLLYTILWHRICIFISLIADFQRDLLKPVSNVQESDDSLEFRYP